MLTSVSDLHALQGCRLYQLVADLVHWPAPMTPDWKADKPASWLDTLRAMEMVYQGKSRPSVRVLSRCRSRSQSFFAGISNVSVAYLEDLLKIATVICESGRTSSGHTVL